MRKIYFDKTAFDLKKKYGVTFEITHSTGQNRSNLNDKTHVKFDIYLFLLLCDVKLRSSAEDKVVSG